MYLLLRNIRNQSTRRVSLIAIGTESHLSTFGTEHHRLHNSNQDNEFETKFKIYNAVENRKVNLSTVRQNIINWYSCGPTVYSSAHIGHASSYIRQDVIRRIMESLGGDISIVHVMGITDIDDKIIKAANERQVPWQTITKNYEDEFVQDLVNLNVKLPHIRARVSHFVPQIVTFVQNLISNGSAYTTKNGSVYFDTNKYKNYDLFRKSECETEEMIHDDTDKLHVKDFALWKGQKPGEPFWGAPWGNGRPGWHIECSVMASHYFGDRLDIHSGGWDLMFPHHQNEEAQCCARFNLEKWVSHWIHTGHLHFHGDEKMSKSLGNTILIKDFLSQESADVLRMFCILSKYRSSLVYSSDSLSNAKKVLLKFKSFLTDCDSVLNGVKSVVPKPGSEALIWERLIDTKSNVYSSLLDDFDTSQCIFFLLDYLKDFNRDILIPGQEMNSVVNYGLVLTTKSFVQNFLEIVGMQLDNISSAKTSDNLTDPIMTELIEFRNTVRNYSLATGETDRELRKVKIKDRQQLIKACDEVRVKLRSCGIDVKDHGDKSSWTYNKS